MDSLKERAAQRGIDTEYWDGLGQRRSVGPETLARLLEVLTPFPGVPGQPSSPDASTAFAYQGLETAHRRQWALAVQLYGVKSRRNWGHGDFTDLYGLVELAASLGASAVGLNPLHALFDESPGDISPYSPSSRLFLNTRYIDPEAIPEFSTVSDAAFADVADAARRSVLVDYAAVVPTKFRALALCYQAFRKRGTKARKSAFTDFRKRNGVLLTRFACFEVLRRRFGTPWWTWPEEWRAPDDRGLAALRKKESAAAGFHEFLQWVASTQLNACKERAASLNMPIGLYLDIAVGVRADGFDAWNEQGVVERAVEIGAPPDALNRDGQRWGLAGLNPFALEAADFAPFRHVLRPSMQYAGAIRLDHVMALQRLFLIPEGFRGDQGAYVNFPFAQMLAITAEESAANRCIVIGEDLGTVPERFRETLARAGIWSYQVMLFQRAADGGFIAPGRYSENALVTFSTHDLPTFEGWKAGHDLDVQRALGLKAGETAADRSVAREAMARTMTWHGHATLDYPGVVGFLASTPSRLLAISAEDALALTEQVNVPGTIAEHPNWRRKLPVDLEDLGSVPLLKTVADSLATAGRSFRQSP